MKSFFARPMALLLLLAFTAASASAQAPPNKAEQDQLFHTIESLDAQLFTAYNTCDMPKFDSLIAEDVEFYHDQGGITLGRKDLSDAISKNVCHKVHRELVKGTLEVYPMKRQWGALWCSRDRRPSFHQSQHAAGRRRRSQVRAPLAVQERRLEGQPRDQL